MQTYQEALELALRVVGKINSTTCTLYHNMGIYYKDTDNYGLAYEYFRKSYGVRYELYGRHHPATLKIVTRLNEPTYVRIAKERGDEVPEISTAKSACVRAYVSACKLCEPLLNFGNVGLLGSAH